MIFKRWGSPENTPNDAAQPPMTAAMQELTRAGYANLANAVTNPASRENLRHIWRFIDEATVGASGIARMFAGISQDGTRYLEVYGNGGLYDTSADPTVWVASARIKTPDTVDISTGERQSGTRNGEVPVLFSEPAAPDASQPALLKVRPALYGGTSAYYTQANNHATYDGEVFTMASLQVMADFDPEQLRTSAADNGETAGRPVKINAGPRIAQSPPDFDDIAM